MKGLMVCLLLIPALVHGTTLDHFCGSQIVVSEYYASSYYVYSAAPYRAECRVHFNSPSGGKIELTITGSGLDPSRCRINVRDYNDINSHTLGDLEAHYFSFRKSITSNGNTGELYLHIQGFGCDDYHLTFAVQRVSSSYPQDRVCVDFTCDNGDCALFTDVCDGVDDCSDGSDEDNCAMWTAGDYAAVSISVFVVVCIVAAIAGVCYRRRIVLVRSPAAISSRTVVMSSQSVVQSRW